MLTLNDGRNELWQWDTGRKLTVDADCSQVHFSNKVFGRSIDVDVVDGVAVIPDILLQTDKDLNVWAFVGTAENGYTKIGKTFKVNRRNKPADYVFTPSEQTTLSELVERLDEIEESQGPDAIKDAVNDYLEQNPVEAPVQSVNGKTGKVDLTAEDVGAISQDKLQESTNEALAQAKASGEFDGEPGAPGKDYVLTPTDKAEIAEMAAGLVEIPDSGGNPDYEQNDTSAPDYIKNRPFYTETDEDGNETVHHLDGKYIPDSIARSEEVNAVDKKVDTLRKVVSKFHSNIVETASGEIIQLSDASDMELAGLRIFGKTVQNGTPTPDAPVPLESVGDGGSVGVTMAGKNLLTAQQMYNQASGYLETTLDGRNCVRMTSERDVLFTPGFLKPNTQYTVSMLCKNVLDPSHTTASGNNLIMFIYDDGTKSYLYNTSASTDWVEKTATSKAGKTVVSIGINPYDYRNYTYIDVDTFQFEEGATTTKYEPYKGQPLTIQKPADVPVLLPGIPVASDGNYTDENGQQWICDEVDFAKGVYVQRIGTKQLDGSESWGYTGAYFSTFHDALGSNSSYLGLCSHFNDDSFFVGPGGFGFYHTSQSVEDWKAWLAENNPTLIFALAKYIETPLTDEELAQYAALHTNYHNTTVFNDKNADMDVKYVADTKLYIDKKFAELSAALLNQ